MESSSANEWKVGDLGRTKEGHCVFIKEIIGNRYLKVEKYSCNCNTKHEKMVFIPAHGEIEKFINSNR